SGAERAVEPIRPRVVRALNRLPAALSLDEERSAVAADVEERAWPLLVPDDEHRHLAGPGCKPVADVVDAPRMADVLPRPPEDAPLLAAEDIGVGIPAPRDRHGPNLPRAGGLFGFRQVAHAWNRRGQ